MKRSALAIGSGGIGFSAQMTDSQFAAGVAEGMRAIGRAVVRHDTLYPHAMLEEAGHAGSEEGAGGVSLLVGHDAGQGDTGGIIDGHVYEVSADTTIELARPSIAGNAMSDAIDSSELFDIQMQQLSRSVALVAQHGQMRFQIAPA